MAFIPTIGLEVHAELKTKTKMFCDSANDPDEVRPNANTCPICLAHPGTLPTINAEAVRHILRVGAAIGGTQSSFSEFDRKSYFYPDIPKGYQISQYQYPLITGGSLDGVAITRVHLEEDTARSIHAGGKTLVDFNRAGIPLMELVTEPAIHSAEEAGAFARELQLLLRTLRAGEANLEKGQMRVEANISVSAQEGVFGTKVEVKNLNSFRSVERAIAFEIARQCALIDSGGTVVQETRGWDEVKQETFSQRVKEGSADYRYFPDPDLPKLYLGKSPAYAPETIRASLPELPWEHRARYADAYGISDKAIAYIVGDSTRGAFFDAVATELANDAALVGIAANYLISDVAGIGAKQGTDSCATLDPSAFAKLIRLIASGEVSSRGAKDVLAILIERGGNPETIAQEEGLMQESSPDALRAAVERVIETEARAVEEYRSGKEAALQYLLGKAIAGTKGAGNPSVLRDLLVETLEKGK